MKKTRLPLAFIALVFAFGAVFAFTAKKAPIGKMPIDKTNVIYHYTSSSTDLEDMQDTSNWKQESPVEECGNTGTIPCTKLYSDDWDDFIEFLDGYEDAGELIGDCTTRKP